MISEYVLGFLSLPWAIAAAFVAFFLSSTFRRKGSKRCILSSKQSWGPAKSSRGVWKLGKENPSAELKMPSTFNDHSGRQIWTFYKEEDNFDETEARIAAARCSYEKTRFEKHNSSDVVYRSLRLAERGGPATPVPLDESKDLLLQISETLRLAIDHVEKLQSPDGHFPSDYGGPHFLLPGLVITCFITGVRLPEQHRFEMLRYFRNHQRKDGGTGLHIEGHSTMFGTSLNYVAARICGFGAEDPYCVRARKWMKTHGGCVASTSWGKFWLCVLNVYDYKGINPLPPEMWLMPEFLPFHPWRYWCHTRMVYLPMSYLYARRAALDANTPLVQELRSELYAQPYDEIDWPSHRNTCAPEDLYTKHSWVQDAIWTVVYKLEPWIPAVLREKAIRKTMEMIRHEDESSNYLCIGPVNKALNMLCRYCDDPESKGFKLHIPRIYDYLWLAEDGMKMQGYNGSQLWDVSFFARAVAETGLAPEYPAMCRKMLSFLDKNQMRQNVPDKERFYRDASAGGFPFSTADNGWIVADCSAEALKAVLVLQGSGLKELVSKDRLRQCVDVILAYRNEDSDETAFAWGNGGWATYEKTRGPSWLEFLNPSECFGGIMIDYSYVELTSACVQGLAAYAKIDPEYNAARVQNAIHRGAEWIRKSQRADGSWYGSWAICFTYGIWFGVEGLACCGDTYESSKHLKNAVAFLLSKQRDDGGWGESYLSSSSKEYEQADESQVANTSWAIMALVKAIEGASKDHQAAVSRAIERAAKFLISTQDRDDIVGEFPQQLISGVFNHNCMISYSWYRNAFAIWSLAEAKRYLSDNDKL